VVRVIRRQQPINWLFGIMAVIIYLTFTFISRLYYPGPYGPLTNSLSDLGNPQQNPSGATFYNTGCILMGLTLIPFYLGLRHWNTGEKKMKVLLIAGQITGMFSSLSIILASVFPPGPHTATHGFWAGMLFISTAFFWVFSAFSLLRHPASIKWIAYYSFLPLIAIAIAAVIPDGRFVGEWVTVAMFMSYVIMLSYNARAINLAHRER
jgi:hypothetical membrane protein